MGQRSGSQKISQLRRLNNVPHGIYLDVFSKILSVMLTKPKPFGRHKKNSEPYFLFLFKIN